MYQYKITVKTDIFVAMYWQNSDSDVNTSTTSSSTEDEWTMTTLSQRYSNGRNVVANDDHVPNSSGREAGLSTRRNSPSTMRQILKTDVKQLDKRQRTNGDNQRQRSSRNNPETANETVRNSAKTSSLGNTFVQHESKMTSDTTVECCGLI